MSLVLLDKVPYFVRSNFSSWVFISTNESVKRTLEKQVSQQKHATFTPLSCKYTRATNTQLLWPTITF